MFASEPPRRTPDVPSAILGPPRAARILRQSVVVEWHKIMDRVPAIGPTNLPAADGATRTRRPPSSSTGTNRATSVCRAPVAGPAEERRSGLQSGLRNARWLTEDGLHLTLAFIGEVDGSMQPRIEAALAGVTAPALRAELHGIGCFPPRGAPRVLWIGASPKSELVLLAQAVRRALGRAGLTLERRRFMPHVTIARFRRPPPPAELERYFGATPCSGRRGPTLRRSTCSRACCGPRGRVTRLKRPFPCGMRLSKDRTRSGRTGPQHALRALVEVNAGTTMTTSFEPTSVPIP